MFPAKILAVKTSSLGDILHTFPAIALIHELSGGAEIHWLANSSFIPVIRYCGEISKTIEFPRDALSSFKTFPGAFIKLCRELRGEKYDAVIDFQGLFRNAFISRICGAPLVAGFEDPKEALSSLLYTRRIRVDKKHVHAVEKNIALAAGFFNRSFKAVDYQLKPVPEFELQAANLLDSFAVHREDILVGITAGARWRSKQWPPQSFAELIRKISAADPRIKFLLLGSRDESPICAVIRDICASQNVLDLSSRTSLGQLVEVIRKCRCLICNDSGPMHIAASLNVPVMAFFGPTIPARTGPYGSIHHVFQTPLPCKECLKRNCPLGTFECQNSVKSDEVYRKVMEILK